MKEYFNIAELSEYLGIKKSTLYAKITSGQIPYYKIGRLVRFKKTEIDHWMEGLRQVPVDTERKATDVVRGLTRNIDIGGIIKKTIASVKTQGYNSASGKPGQSLGKGVDDGTI